MLNNNEESSTTETLSQNDKKPPITKPTLTTRLGDLIPAPMDNDATIPGPAISTIHKLLDECVENGKEVSQVFPARWSKNPDRPSTTVRAYNAQNPEQMSCNSLLIYAQALTGKFPKKSTRMNYVPAASEGEGPSYRKKMLDKDDKWSEELIEHMLSGYFK